MPSSKAIKSFLPFVIIGVVAALTITIGAMLYRAKRVAAVTMSEELTVAAQATDSVHARGSADAPVTLEEFGDFQCPPCGRLAGPLHEIEKDYGARLRVIFRNFPFASHEHAREAAYAAEAAGLQGHFWEMHDLLYREQANWSKTKDVQPLFTSYAGMLGLNLDRFKTDVSSEKVKEKVESDQNRGEALGVKNTPTIFINNQSVPPTSLNPIALRAAIDAALREKKAPE
ncbi:MAG: thioredoxin domain-containing protein [Chthoniobacterales bacterium]